MSNNDKPKSMISSEVRKPFIVGNVSFPIQKDPNTTSDNPHTHEWCIYVRGLENEDMSYFIDKVTFKLFNTYENPLREITEPPYEVWESGWGEFVIDITIYFIKEAKVEPITLKHTLKLFPDSGQNISSARKKPVINEIYDEFIFKNPTKNFFDLVTSTANRRFDKHRLIGFFNNNKFVNDEAKHLKQLDRANNQVKKN